MRLNQKNLFSDILTRQCIWILTTSARSRPTGALRAVARHRGSPVNALLQERQEVRRGPGQRQHHVRVGRHAARPAVQGEDAALQAAGGTEDHRLSTMITNDDDL